MRNHVAIVVCLVALASAGCTRASSRELHDPDSTGTSTASATATPAGPELTAELGRTFWAGQVGVWPLSVRLTPAATAEGQWGLEVSGTRLDCESEALNDGWRIHDCAGIPTVDLTLDVPRDASDAMPFELVVLGGGVQPDEVHTGSLHRVAAIEEEQSLNVTSDWRVHDSSLAANTDIWSADGVVFAPHFDGYVELLSAATGKRLSLIDIITAPGTREAEPSTLDVKARDGLLYIATSFHGVLIYDVADATQPLLAGQYLVEAPDGSPESVWTIHNIFLSPDRDLLYVINQTYGASDLRIVDVSTPTSPIEVGRYFLANDDSTEEEYFPHDVNVVTRDGREIAYVNYWDAGLRILDTTDPAAIVEIGAWDIPGFNSHAGWPFEVDGRKYYAHGGEGYDQGLTVLDVTDMAAPRVVGSYRVRPGLSIHNIEVRDGFAYIAYYLDGLRVVDLRDPAHPVEVAHYDTVSPNQERELFQGAWGIRLDGDQVFVSDRGSGVLALRVELPED